jgi:hypothetical protein
MLGFKRFETAAVTIRGIELAEKIENLDRGPGRLNLQSLSPDKYIYLTNLHQNLRSDRLMPYPGHSIRVCSSVSQSS